MIRETKTENGLVRGLPAADPRITAFKGIPFAAPPVGENRWRAPQPAKDWEGVRDCFQFAPISIQDQPGVGTDIYCREWHVDPDIPMDEDCLYLNVWTGAKSLTDKLPVYVWIFGGALQWGYPAEMEFDGERMARRDIVVVTINYRINVFGFLTHPDITKEAPDAPANFGNLDQQAAIRWVKRNIANFGGDPDNITIGGQSAGGGSVLSQLACPANEGLFQKAVIMSAMIRNPYKEDLFGLARPLQESEAMGEALFEALGVKTLEEARALDAKTILAKYSEMAGMDFTKRFFTTRDDKFCFGDAMELVAAGKYVKVPILSGNTRDEFHNFVAAGSKEEFEEKAKELFGDLAQEYLACSEAYATQGDNLYGEADGIGASVKAVFELAKQNGNPNNFYYYLFDVNIPGWDHPGTFHSVDLWFFFETLAKCWRPFKGSHYDTARQMCNYLCNFIKNGDPNGEDCDGEALPVWEPYSEEKPGRVVFKEGEILSLTTEDTPYEKVLKKQLKAILK